MANHSIPVQRIADHSLVRFFLDASKIIGSDNVVFQVFGYTNNIVAKKNNEEFIVYEGFDWILNSDNLSISHITTSRPGIHIHLTRGGDPNASIYKELLHINADQNQTGGQPPLDAEKLLTINGLVTKYFFVAASSGSPLLQDAASVQQVLQAHGDMVTRLEGMVVDIGARATQARIELEAEFGVRKNELEAQFEQRQTEALQTIEEQKRLLVDQEEALRVRTQQLDDRSNTHARRAQHENLKARIADRFKNLDLTPQTKSSRTPIHLAVAITGLILASLIAVFTYEAVQTLVRPDSTYAERILVIAKSATASLGFLGIISWYLRWLNRWFERLADAEFQLKQFELDINRAQWVVETAFEWKISQDAPIPDALLSNISQNLFSKPDRDENSDMHPADYLASALIGKASNVKLAVPGAEIELGPKALKGAS